MANGNSGLLGEVGDALGKAAASAFGDSVPVTVSLSPFVYVAIALAVVGGLLLWAAGRKAAS